MSKAKLDKKIVLRDEEKVILCEYDSLLDTYSYYLCSIEGHVIMVINNCNCEQIPTIMKSKADSFSLAKKREEERENFKAWLEYEGYKE